MIKSIIQEHAQNHAQYLQHSFNSAVTDIRQELVMFKGTTPTSAPPLNEQSSALYTTIKCGLDSSLTNLHVK